MRSRALSDVALSYTRSHPTLYPLSLALWLTPALSGVFLCCLRLLRAPLLPLFAVGWLGGLIGMVWRAPSLYGPVTQAFGGYSLAMMNVAGLLYWALSPKVWDAPTRRALVVCGIDAVALFGCWPEVWGWLAQAQGLIVGVVLVGMMVMQNTEKSS